jgi:hypothetical protein
MATLLELSHDLLNLAAQLDELAEMPDEQQQVVWDWLEEIWTEKQSELKTKLESYAQYIRELELRAEARKAEAKRLADRARVDENRAKCLKFLLMQFFQAHDLKTIETATFKLTLARNGGKCPVILDETYSVAEIPDELCKVERTPDLNAIRAALENGHELEFARLGDRGQSMRIR